MKPFPILPFGSSVRADGHTGTGGSFGFADPDRGLGYAYVMNRAGSPSPRIGVSSPSAGALTVVLDLTGVDDERQRRTGD